MVYCFQNSTCDKAKEAGKGGGRACTVSLQQIPLEPWHWHGLQSCAQLKIGSWIFAALCQPVMGCGLCKNVTPREGPSCELSAANTPPTPAPREMRAGVTRGTWDSTPQRPRQPPWSEPLACWPGQTPQPPCWSPGSHSGSHEDLFTPPPPGII